MNPPPFPEIASLWRETAALKHRYPRLKNIVQCDVAIVGGGYTGLSTARHLALRGLDPVVVDASRIGWGASGRNGGVVSGKFRLSFADCASRYGMDMARRMAALAHEAVDLVAETVDACGIADARLRIAGNLRCAHNDIALARLRDERDWLASNMGDTSSRLLSRQEVIDETGSSDFVGGLLNPQAGLIHPLNYARGLAANLAEQGIRLFEQSPVLRIRRAGDRVEVITPDGAVSARHVALATNAYSDLTPATARLARTLVPFRSAMVATEPLPPALLATLLREDRSYSETRRMMRWFRKVDDRILFGGRGAFGRDDSDAAFAALRRKMAAIFPQLAQVRITHRWSGLVAMTLDSVPHVGPWDERICYAVGYNGAGVAMATLMGRYLADIVQGGRPDIGLLAAPRLRTVPCYPLREPIVRLVAGWYQFLDAIGR
ncbi:NAD(P)/FAD-dependent oxidoreductase [Bordetella genomosp. 11]|uniref:FAD-dependent oxidoreductase n=1 Tax=Bordetella genomosp. 11 TaxID=1416808 RepID=A0A261UI24_9BORD|nr:FAD-binding oxidoreductase [Bordetella genomosp. 11]OZI60870.1 FAD-dependent oxidoreductase [Bordetella genomosp. 11]